MESPHYFIGCIFVCFVFGAIFMFPNYYTNEQIVLSKEYKEIAIELDKIEEEYIECISNKAIDECNELKYQLNEIQKQLNDILEENIWKLN